MQDKTKNKTERTIKVSSGTRRTFYKGYTDFPKMLLQGNWLRAAGFAAGDFIKVLVSDNYIQIVKAERGQHERV